MKAVRCLILTVMAVVSLCASRNVRAQTNAIPPAATPPVVVPLQGDTGLRGVPADIKILIRSFDHARDQYLAARNLLLLQLKNATTATEREQIRAQLQANRAAFLAAQNGFRLRLKDELAALKGKISHDEFLRIIDAAQRASIEGGLNHHKGH